MRTSHFSLKFMLGLLMAASIILVALIYYLQNPSFLTAASTTELSPLPALPDLSRLDSPVRRQFRERYDYLSILMRQENPRPEDLAWGFGQLGRIYHAYQKFAEASICYQNAHRLAPDEFRWVYLLGQLKRTLGDYQNASKLLQKALQLRPDDLPTLIWLAESKLGQQQPDVAEQYLRQALAQAPDNAMVLYGLARIARARQQFELALDFLETALLMQPDAHQLHYLLGQIHIALGHTAQAEHYFQRLPKQELLRISIEFDDPLMQQVADLRRSAQSDTRRARKALAQGHYRLAERLFEKAINVNPQRIDTRYNLAVALLRLGHRQQSIDQLEQIIMLRPEHALSHLLLARLLNNEQRFADAERHLRAAIAADAELARAHWELANLLDKTGRLEQSQQSYQQALRLDPALASSAQEN